MGTHPIFESDFDCLTESEMDDEFAKFMSEVNDTPALVAPEPAPAGPRKRGLPAAYANRTNMFSSLKPKVQKIEVCCQFRLSILLSSDRRKNKDTIGIPSKVFVL